MYNRNQGVDYLFAMSGKQRVVCMLQYKAISYNQSLFTTYRHCNLEKHSVMGNWNSREMGTGAGTENGNLQESLLFI